MVLATKVIPSMPFAMVVTCEDKGINKNMETKKMKEYKEYIYCLATVEYMSITGKCICYRNGLLPLENKTQQEDGTAKKFEDLPVGADIEIIIREKIRG